MTELALDGGILLHSPRPPIIATALQRLYLRYVDTDAELLRGVCNELPSLTELEIYACTDGGNTMRTISGPATGLRQAPSLPLIRGALKCPIICQTDVSLARIAPDKKSILRAGQNKCILRDIVQKHKSAVDLNRKEGNVVGQQ